MTTSLDFMDKKLTLTLNKSNQDMDTFSLLEECLKFESHNHSFESFNSNLELDHQDIDAIENVIDRQAKAFVQGIQRQSRSLFLGHQSTVCGSHDYRIANHKSNDLELFEIIVVNVMGKPYFIIFCCRLFSFHTVLIC